MKNKFVKKIVMGKYKGTILKIPSLQTTRSSKNIVLESFFNTIQFEIIDTNFVEVFSGSGSIGLEALSRGAKQIYFMEKDKNALKILKENIKKTNSDACKVFGGDSFVNIKDVVVNLKRKNEDAYFYIDPPFSCREGMQDIYDNMIDLIASLPKDSVKMIVIEHMTGLKLPKNIGNFNFIKIKKFGKTSLSTYS